MKENNLQQLYFSAIGFYRSGIDAAMKIKNSREDEAFIVVPVAATNLSFSAELFLKLLYFMKTESTELRLHKLSDIFAGLPGKISAEVKRKYEHFKEDDNNELVPVRYSFNTTFGNENDQKMKYKITDLTIDQLLELHDNSFVNWRYVFESTTNYMVYDYNFKLMSNFIIALKVIIDDNINFKNSEELNNTL